mmetsp:Transcript_37414/g.45579  ORF Transcript_37414/g.45579 Transcript_37414/m.45579 type:complete len:255 (-) Transcript_37414:1244-2008(-)
MIRRVSSVPPEEALTLNADEKTELEKMLLQDKVALQVLKNTLVVYNIFHHEIQEVKTEEEKKGDSSEKLATIEAIGVELSSFYSDPRMLEHMDLVNDVLAILKRSNLKELMKELIENVVCIFEAHLPDLEQMFKQLKAKAESGPAENSEIRMRHIGQKEDAKQNRLFKNVDWELPARLNQFTDFCLRNKKAINLLLQGRNKANIGISITDIVKYMPNLLDFESKRAFFAKELEKMREHRGHGRLRVRINRNNIF